MLGMHYVVPYAAHRSNIGSNAGVPLILKGYGLIGEEGHHGYCYNLAIKRAGHFLRGQELVTSISQCLDYLGNCSGENFIITRLSLGPRALPDSTYTDVIQKLTLPSNVALNGQWLTQTSSNTPPFVLSVLDLRSSNSAPVDLTNVIFKLCERHLDKTTVLFNTRNVRLDNIDSKQLTADYARDGKSAGWLLIYEMLMLANAALVIKDEHVTDEKLQQVQHWCQLYNIPHRMCSLLNTSC